MEGPKTTEYQRSNTGKRTSYLDCFTLTVGKTYSVDNEARRDITMQALREVTE